MRDVRAALRSPLRNPGFSTVVVLTLALGIGANTAIFSLLDALVLRSLPVPAARELVQYQFTASGPIPGYDVPVSFTPQFWLSGPLFDGLRTRQSASTDVFAWGHAAESLALAERGVTTTVRAAWASGSAFRVLDVQPALGRLLEPGDDRPGGGANGWTAAISYRWWQEAWHGDPAIIGRSVIVNSVPVTIVGVLPAVFTGVLVGDDPQIVLPLDAEPAMLQQRSFRHHPGLLWLLVMGRLKPGETLQRASADLDRIAPQLIEEAMPRASRDDFFSALRMSVTSGRSGGSIYRVPYQKPLMLVQVLVAAVLSLVCANVAGLLLAHGASRDRELQIRGALGASRGRLVRQLLAEHALLAGIALPLGILLAYWTSHTAVAMVTPAGSVSLDVTPDLAIVAVAVASALGSVAVSGMVPALIATRRLRTDALRISTRQSAPSAWIGAGRWLMPIQVALTLTLVAVAGLSAASLIRLLADPTGMPQRDVVLAPTSLQQRPERGTELVALYRRMLENLRAQPGVRAASLVRNQPMGMELNDRGILARLPDGRVYEDPRVSEHVVAASYFDTVGARLLAGRDFREADTSSSPLVCILNQSAARFFFRGVPVIGAYVEAPAGAGHPPVRYEIVGIVEDAKYITLHEDPPRTIYLPYAQNGDRFVQLAFVLSGADPRLLAEASRRTVERFVPDTPAIEPIMLRARMLASIVSERTIAWLSGFLGLLSLAVTCVSLYGQVSWAVTRRTAEIGVRLALGGTRARIIRMIVGRVLLVVSIGTVTGLAGVGITGRYVAAILYHTRPLDPILIGGAVSAVALTCLLAAYLPARRASRLEPTVALRQD